jgi:hypothetical protein
MCGFCSWKIQNEKQPKYPSVGNWVSKMVYVHRMEYYTALKGAD